MYRRGARERGEELSPCAQLLWGVAGGTRGSWSARGARIDVTRRSTGAEVGAGEGVVDGREEPDGIDVDLLLVGVVVDSGGVVAAIDPHPGAEFDPERGDQPAERQPLGERSERSALGLVEPVGLHEIETEPRE